MNLKIFDSLGTYGDIYFYLANGSKPREDICKYLKSTGKSATTAKDHTKKAAGGELPFISCNDGTLALNNNEVSEFIKEFASAFQLEASIETKQKTRRKPEDHYTALINSHSPAFMKQKKEADEAKTQVQLLSDELAKKDEMIAQLQKQISENVDDAILKSIDAKVLVIGTVKLKPEERFKRDFFLDNPERLLDVETLVSRYGGEITSPYIPLFVEKNELTTENYLHKIGRQLLGGKLLKSRLEEQERLPAVVNPDDDNEEWVKRKSISRSEIERNRLESVNAILAMDNISNQMKLSLYAAWFDKVDSELVELLDYAGEQGINADYVIRLLEKPKDYRNYRTIRGLLKQAKKASEAHIKRKAAIELISGEWYVEAEYKGKHCRFQMMPVDEMLQFREMLRKHQTLEALCVLERMLMEKREASFVGGDVDGEIKVNDKQIAAPEFLHATEKKSGVNCHSKINDDFAYDGFFEAE